MFGLEMLDVVIGLMFVYLLLSLFATALNEYITAVMNLRGKELARGLGRLLEDLDEKESVKKAFAGVVATAAGATATLTERFYGHPLIRPLATRRGWAFRAFHKEPRLPSYIPARTFAMALLDVLGYTDAAAQGPADVDAASRQAALVGIMGILKRDSPLDVSELKGLLATANLPEPVQLRLLQVFTGSQNRLQHLHDGVEVWFNNAMDRVSGAYKRSIQGVLLVLGIVIAACMNADTVDIWRRLSANDALARAMAERAEAAVARLDSVVLQPPAAGAAPAGDTAAVRRARENYQTARARLDSTELSLGWTRKEAMRIGVLKPDSTYAAPPPAIWIRNPGFWGKLLGLLLTGIAISLGAPFWFDLLNKVISIRSAGRSPAEKPKSPEGGPKRSAEQTPK